MGFSSNAIQFSFLPVNCQTKNLFVKKALGIYACEDSKRGSSKSYCRSIFHLQLYRENARRISSLSFFAAQSVTDIRISKSIKVRFHARAKADIAACSILCPTFADILRVSYIAAENICFHTDEKSRREKARHLFHQYFSFTLIKACNSPAFLQNRRYSYWK